MFSRFARPSSINTAVIRSATFRFCSGVRPSTQVICTCGIALPPDKSTAAFYPTRCVSACLATDWETRLFQRGGDGGRRRVLRRDGTRPDNLEGGLAADKHLGALAHANGQCVVTVGAEFAQSLFFRLQALIGAIQSHSKLMRPGRQQTLQAH